MLSSVGVVQRLALQSGVAVGGFCMCTSVMLDNQMLSACEYDGSGSEAWEACAARLPV